MLTYNPNIKPKRKDLPWLLVVMVLIWVFGTVFFHSPWEPFEPIVFAVVKGIITNNNWFVPTFSGVPYLEVQPFYFWIYAIPIKILNIQNIDHIANAVRIINTLIIFAIIIISANLGSRLPAFKNGRSVALILISCVGFVSNSYLLSPNLLVILGYCLYIYALSIQDKLPGTASGILFFALSLVSINFTAQYCLISLLVLIILPVVNKVWRNLRYLASAGIGVSLFLISFAYYAYQLKYVNYNVFQAWFSSYTNIIHLDNYNLLSQIIYYLQLLAWYIAPAWVLCVWSFYKRKLKIFTSPVLQLSIILIVTLFLSAVFSGVTSEIMIFPIIIPVVLVASIEIDTIRISIVSLFNWFSVFAFALVGLIVWGIYFAFIFNYPPILMSFLYAVSQNFVYQFNLWQLLLAILITIIWLVMVTRKHIRGREMVTNWAAGFTFALVLFMALGLPWLDSVLSFRPMVQQSLNYIKPNDCVATNTFGATTHNALWYFYGDINLLSSFTGGINSSICNQALLALDDLNNVDLKDWQIIWRSSRPIDKRFYLIVRHKTQNY